MSNVREIGMLPCQGETPEPGKEAADAEKRKATRENEITSILF